MELSEIIAVRIYNRYEIAAAVSRVRSSRRVDLIRSRRRATYRVEEKGDFDRRDSISGEVSAHD